MAYPYDLRLDEGANRARTFRVWENTKRTIPKVLTDWTALLQVRRAPGDSELLLELSTDLGTITTGTLSALNGISCMFSYEATTLLGAVSSPEIVFDRDERWLAFVYDLLAVSPDGTDRERIVQRRVLVSPRVSVMP